ncbi:MAG: PqqD family protein [Lachnospiraceae bacterium]|nr:PqqD family protein [Lachnospiraceae bacterium]
MKIKKEFVLRNIAGESILVPTGTTTEEFNGMITLSETAAFIWENLEEAETFQQLVQLILDEFEVEDQLAARDAFGFISELVKRGICEPEKEDGSW